jgi:methyltransferase (TIGR00027 family)
MKPIYSAVGGQILSRSRYAEDRLEIAIKNGVKQYVLLGAGMDSYALRHPELSDRLTIYEVDHPATQKSKKERFIKLAKELPENLVFVPVNFEEQTISEALRQTSFKPDEPAFFSWIATTFYLTRKSIFETLSSIYGFASEYSEIVFDYSIADSSLSPEGEAESKVTKKFVARRGEVYLSNFEHQEIVEEVNKLGYQLIEQATPDLIERQYFSDRKDKLKAALWAAMIHLRIK